MVYVDTSALIKRYIAEANSDEFDAFFMARTPLSIRLHRILYARWTPCTCLPPSVSTPTNSPPPTATKLRQPRRFA
jgi:hypothetical protein